MSMWTMFTVVSSYIWLFLVSFDESVDIFEIR